MNKARWNWQHNQVIGSLSMAIGCLNSAIQCPSVRREHQKEAQVLRDHLIELRGAVKRERINQDRTVTRFKEKLDD